VTTSTYSQTMNVQFDGVAVDIRHGFSMLSGPCFGKQSRRCGVNREQAGNVSKQSLVETIKGVGSY
jgi:hypothetical protein